jgi:predicted membrane-bound mannosyltransferase
LILAVAALFRLWRFDALPFGVWYDEAEHGLQALRILDSEQFRPIFEGAITGPAHYLYLVAAAFEWFGVSVQSIRLVSVGFGLLAVLAGYLVGAELFGWRLGLVAAALLAVHRVGR